MSARRGQEPSPYTEPDQDSGALSPREQETADGLRRLDPELAGLYELGRNLVNEIEEPGYAHTVAYIGRELSRGVIRCRLRDEGVDEAARDLTSTRCGADGERNRQTIAAALQLPEDDPRVTEWLRMPQRFAGWQKFRNGGLPPDTVRDAFDRFSQMLFGLAAPYYATEAQLDALLEVDSPAAEHARRLRDIQLRPAQRRYFFERLRDARWVAHLRREGFFANPPGRETNDDGSWSPRWWPEGDYLARVASDVPAEVTKVLLALPLANDNPTVWNSVARAASAFPAELAIRVVPALTSALKSVQGLSNWSDDVVGLIEHLAASGCSEAFDLADHLLFVAGTNAVDPEDLAYQHTTAWVMPRLDGQDFHGVVDRMISALEGTDPERTLRLLLCKISRVQQLANTLRTGSRLLSSNVEMHLRESLARSNAPHRPETNTVRIIGHSVVGVVRRLAKNGPKEAASVVALVEERKGRFFATLKYHVLATAGHFLRSRLDRFLQSEEARNPGYHAAEVATVLCGQLRNASAHARKAYADAVAEGPDRGEVRARLEEWSGKEVTDDEVEHRVREWQRRILTFFRGDIPLELQRLASELDHAGVTPPRQEQQMAEQGFYSEAGFGDIWRGEARSFAGWAVEDVLGFLRNGGSADYVALEAYAKDTPAGGVGILADCASGEVGIGVVDGLLGGLAEAVKSGAQLDWSSMLRSLRQVVRQITTLEAPNARGLVEYRRAADYGARLIRQGCVDDAIPAEYARDLWDVLDDAATLDEVWSDPSRDHVADLDGVLLAGLNHPSGTITRAVIGAGLWQYRSCLQGSQAPSDEDKAAARGVVQGRLVPILDALLEVSGPYRSVPRAVIGERLPWLYLLVPEWVDRNAERLFQGCFEDPVQHPAWTAYVLKNRLYDAVFHALRPWYLGGARKAGTWRTNLGRVARRPEKATRRFAVHFMTAFLRGWIQRGDDDRLIETAYGNLSPSDWADAYSRISRDFADGDEPVPAGIIERLTALWEWRIEELTRQNRTAAPATATEARGLAHLLSTPHIPAEAVVRHGLATARLAEGRVLLDWGQLLDLAHSQPEGAFEIADAVLRGTLKARYGYVLVERVKPLLEFILRAAGAEVTARARTLISHLGEHGYRDFRDLLDDPAT